MKNRKAQGLPINIVIILVISVIGLMLILGFTLGGWKKPSGQVTEISKGTEEEAGGISKQLTSVTSLWKPCVNEDGICRNDISEECATEVDANCNNVEEGGRFCGGANDVWKCKNCKEVKVTDCNVGLGETCVDGSCVIVT